MRREDAFNAGGGTTTESSLRGYIKFMAHVMLAILEVRLESIGLLGPLGHDRFVKWAPFCARKAVGTSVLMYVGLSVVGLMAQMKPEVVVSGASRPTMRVDDQILKEMKAAYQWWDDGARMPDEYYIAYDDYIVAQEQADAIKGGWCWPLHASHNFLWVKYQLKADTSMDEMVKFEREREMKLYLVHTYLKLVGSAAWTNSADSSCQQLAEQKPSLLMKTQGSGTFGEEALDEISQFVGFFVAVWTFVYVVTPVRFVSAFVVMLFVVLVTFAVFVWFILKTPYYYT